MILKFRTKRNINGNARYLWIDTTARKYCRECRAFIMDGIEIKARDYNEILNQIKKEGFIEEA